MALIPFLLDQKELPSFSASWLLPHYPHEQCCPFNTAAAYQKFSELFNEADEEKAKLAEWKAKFMLAVEKEQGSQEERSCLRKEENPLLVEEDEVKGSQEEGSSLSNFINIEEFLTYFSNLYEAYISDLSKEVDLQAENLYKWANSTIYTLVDKYPVEPKEKLAELFQVVEDFFGTRQHSSSSNELLLHIVLHLEMFCASNGSTKAVKKVIEILIRLHNHVNPSLPFDFMHKVMPFYIGRCKDVFLEIYNNFQYTLPVELRNSSSPSSSYVQPSVRGQEGTKSDADEPEATQDDSNCGCVKKRLARHRSFQEQSLSRQIMIPQKKKKKSHKNKNMKAKKSPRVPFKTHSGAAKRSRSLGRSACRRLFHRSHTVASINNTKFSDDEKESVLSNGSTKGNQVLVEETPLKKQVEDFQKFKQESLRLKASSSTSHEVLTIEESPRRPSFYSARKLTRLTPNFKTPPLNDGQSKQYSPADVVLKKDPSPATIHSLLHDKFTSPSIHSTVSSSFTVTTNLQCSTADSCPSTSATAQHYDTVKPDDMLSSEEIFQPCSTEKRSSSQGFRSARMLTYGETSAENPSEPVIALASATTPVKYKKSNYRPFQSPKKSLTPTNTKTRTPIRLGIVASYRTKSVPSTPTQSSEFPRTPTKRELTSMSSIGLATAGYTPTKYNRTPSKVQGSPLKLRRRLVILKSPTKEAEED